MKIVMLLDVVRLLLDCYVKNVIRWKAIERRRKRRKQSKERVDWLDRSDKIVA